MNKIVLDNKDIINLKVIEDSICNIDKSYKINELNIELNDGVKFIINQYSEVDKLDYKVNVIQNNNTEFIYNHSFINEDEYNLNIFINMNKNNSKNIINVHGITDNGRSSINVDGSVFDKTNGNELDERIKMINIEDGESFVYPNMFINTKNVIANHSASISNISEDYIFYLNTKGIKRSDAIKLILDGFLNNDAK